MRMKQVARRGNWGGSLRDLDGDGPKKSRKRKQPPAEAVLEKGNKSKKKKQGPRHKFTITPEVFTDQTFYLGCRLKVEEGVLKKMHATLKKRSPNMNCRVETFGRVVDAFDELKIKWVNDMGFGGLMHMRNMRLPQDLCYWLYTRINTIRKSLIAPDGKDFPLSKAQVHWVPGILGRKLKVPTEILDKEMRRRIKAIVYKYGVEMSCNGIPVSVVVKTVEHVFLDNPEDEWEFKTAFLILALTAVLCPTTCYRLASDLLPAATLADKSVQYDWSQIVLDKLLQSVTSFVNKFYPEGYVNGGGGCCFFLAIVDAVYGHPHPLEAKDTLAPVNNT